MTDCSVVIVDDVSDIRGMVRLWLETEGFDVVGEAGNGRDALGLVETERPNVVILDLSMPEMDGLQAIPQIRGLSPDTKILVLSGFTADSMSEEALAAGAHAYMEKGGGIAHLSDKVRELCHAG